MIKRMMIGLVVGFIIGQLIVFFASNDEFVSKLFGVNNGFFVVLSSVLLFMLISSITPNKRKGA